VVRLVAPEDPVLHNMDEQLLQKEREFKEIGSVLPSVVKAYLSGYKYDIGVLKANF
jgi:hypothetical protein